jgi:hypothetical protein
MDENNTKVDQEELNKSLDALIDDLFAEPATDNVEKSIDIAKDADKTADAAVAKAPKAQDDDKRGAGRPKQISDVPATDEDGKRAKNYDGDITEREGVEDENAEAKKQAKSVDQTTGSGDKGAKAPKMRPFMKSENGEEVEIDASEYEAFQAFKKSQAEAAEAEELKKAEDFKKAEEQKQQDLIKSAVSEAVSGLKDENDSLKKSLQETQELIKAMASVPQRSKSITGIEALEKSEDPANKAPESFSKSEMLDAAEELVKSGTIKADQVIELENTGTIFDPAARKAVEKKLQG